MRRFFVLLVVSLTAIGCGVQDTNAPVPQPDSLILGRITAIREVPGEAGVWEVEVREALPEQMQGALRKEARTVPQLDKDVTVKVRVTGDTVCVAGLRAGGLDEFRVGQEVAVNPVPGTTAMVGTKLVTADASELFLFSAYQLRYLTRSLSALPPEVTSPADPAKINSAGLELTPVPLRGGKVVYFGAGLIPGVPIGTREAQPIGAVRPGMRDRAGALAPWAVGGFRPYRVARGKEGWGVPQPVDLPGLTPEAKARITWVNEDETSCLVEVTSADGSKQLLGSQRANERNPWGKLEKLDLAGGPMTGDGQRFGKQLKSIVWTVYDPNGSDIWLAMEGKPGQMLEPRINTMGPEYAPRLGPNQTLYFCRADRQLLFAGGVVQEVRLPGAQRRPLLEATPAADGTLLFFRVPRFTPGGMDWDLAVAGRAGAGWGRPVLLDDWKPQ
jgi:hypothetical protein